jgi:hypothetical protein
LPISTAPSSLEVDNQGRTAIIWAGYVGDCESLDELCTTHPDGISDSDDRGMTALMWAASRGHPQSVAVLLKHGTNVNAQDKSGRTALIHTVRAFRNRYQCMQLLLTAGANVTLTTKSGQSVWDLVQQQSDLHALLEPHCKASIYFMSPSSQSKVTPLVQKTKRHVNIEITPAQRSEFGCFMNSFASIREADKADFIFSQLPGNNMKFSSVQALMLMSQVQSPELRNRIAQHILPCLTDPENLSLAIVVSVEPTISDNNNPQRGSNNRRSKQRRIPTSQHEGDAESSRLITFSDHGQQESDFQHRNSTRSHIVLL